MTKLLAIDTSSEACSAALMVGDCVETLFEIAPQAHSQLILGMCDKLLADAEISLNQIDAIAFSRGPGSFTGLRIGAGVVQGLAYSHDIPIINISSLAALAAYVAKKHQNVNVLPVIDARMQEVYWGLFGIDAAQNISTCGEEVLSLPEDISLTSDEAIIGIGSGWDIYENQLKNRLNVAHIYRKQLVSAEEIVTLAAIKYENNEWLAAEQALPVYIRNNVVKKRQQQ